ncbi:hypothetical protein BRC83_02235 [Halobacteriales archaeon QS_1_68_17]|nr:MAG: hypothetical protein BRC83_02235 [Halobacteriales archaeon QS_1_68_17]
MKCTSDGPESGSPEDRDVPLTGLLTAETLAGYGSVLIAGPAMSGKQRLGLDLLADAYVAGGHPLCVSTTDGAGTVRSVFADYCPPDRAGDLIVVDCVADRQGREADEMTDSVATPGDLTGIAMGISRAYEWLSAERTRGSRLLIDNLSTVVMYAGFEATVRFLHATQAKLDRTGGITIQTMNTDALDTADRQQVIELCDVVVETRIGGQGGTEFRIGGVDGVDREWWRYGRPDPERRWRGRDGTGGASP